MPIAVNCVCHSWAGRYSRWAPNLCCRASGVTKPGSSKIEAILGRRYLAVLRKEWLQSWLNLANSLALITKERPYVSRSSLGAIWTPQDWHEMVSACAGLHDIPWRGHMLVPLLFRIEVAVKLLRAGRPDFQTDLGLPKGRRQVRGRSGIK